MSSKTKRPRRRAPAPEIFKEPVIVQCTKCHNNFEKKSYYDLCEECYYTDVKCIICNSTFKTHVDSNSSVFDRAKHFCSTCVSIRSLMEHWKIGSNIPDGFSTKTDFYLKITFEVTKHSHSGYCSCPDNARTEVSTSVQYFPISNVLTRADFDVGNMINTDNPKLLLYSPTYNHRVCCGNTYQILSAQLVQDIRNAFFS